ncbi:hypothetical protein Tco_1507740, partial [Tanacetum coccineum]
MCTLMTIEDYSSYINVSESAQDKDVGLGGSLFRNFAKKESMKKALQDMLHELGEFNPTYAYYNGSRSSKDNEDPSWSTSFKTRRTQKTSLALEDFILLNTNNVKDSELASLFGKLKYEENLIDSIYETEKNISLVSATPLSTVFFSSSIVQDFQDSPDDEEDTRNSHKYLNDLKEEYQARALLAKSKKFFKKVTQRFSSAKAIDQTKCHKWAKEGSLLLESAGQKL